MATYTILNKRIKEEDLPNFTRQLYKNRQKDRRISRMENKEEILRKKLIEGLEYHGSDASWVKEANIRTIDGKVYIQTEGHDYTFPKGSWSEIKSLISIL